MSRYLQRLIARAAPAGDAAAFPPSEPDPFQAVAYQPPTASVAATTAGEGAVQGAPAVTLAPARDTVETPVFIRSETITPVVPAPAVVVPQAIVPAAPTPTLAAPAVAPVDAVEPALRPTVAAAEGKPAQPRPAAPPPTAPSTQTRADEFMRQVAPRWAPPTPPPQTLLPPPPAAIEAPPAATPSDRPVVSEAFPPTPSPPPTTAAPAAQPALVIGHISVEVRSPAAAPVAASARTVVTVAAPTDRGLSMARSSRRVGLGQL